MAADLPLFPLGSVLFPGLVLPLNIFEPRYRQLVADLLELPEPERTFGVVAIRQGHEVGVDGVHALYDVGCVAHLRRVEKQSDGGYVLVTVGTTRFRLGRLDAASSSYLRGEVDLLDESAGEDAEAVVPAVQRAFRAYLAALASARDTEIEVPELPSDARHLSYLVAATTVVDNADKQALLAAGTTEERLHAELALLKREAALLTTLDAAPALELTRLPQSPN